MIGPLAVGQGYKYLGNMVYVGKVDIACTETKNTPSAFIDADVKDDGIAVPIFMLLTPLLHIRRTSKMAGSVDRLVRTPSLPTGRDALVWTSVHVRTTGTLSEYVDLWHMRNTIWWMGWACGIPTVQGL